MAGSKLRKCLTIQMQAVNNFKPDETDFFSHHYCIAYIFQANNAFLLQQ